jgi:hypothetical protein
VQARVFRRFQQRRRLLYRQGLRRAALAAVRSVDQRRDVPADQVPALGVPQGPGQAIVRLLQRRRGMCDCHLRKRSSYILHSQVAHRDPPDYREHRAQRIPVDLDRLGRPAWQALSQPVGHGHVQRVTRDRPNASV